MRNGINQFDIRLDGLQLSIDKYKIETGRVGANVRVKLQRTCFKFREICDVYFTHTIIVVHICINIFFTPNVPAIFNLNNNNAYKTNMAAVAAAAASKMIF